MEQNRAWKELPACISKGTGYPYAKKRAIQTIHKNELEMTTDLNNPRTITHQAPLAMEFPRQE